jgi:hypothetical protein
MGCRLPKNSGHLPWLIAMVWMFYAPAPVDAQESENLYLLDFHADGYRLAESVPAYESADSLLVDWDGSMHKTGTSCGAWT